MTKRLLFVAALLSVVVIHVPTLALGYQFGFENITGNDPTNAAIGESQLSVDVADAGGNQVLFSFLNSGPEDSSITDIYLDDMSLFNFAGFIDADDGIGGNAGVDFSEGADPGNLPGANEANPSFVAAFSADSDAPAQPNGVNPGESLGILFNLENTVSYQDVLDNLIAGDLRIGIHVQGFANGGSESFVNLPGDPGDPGTPPVPEPGTIALLGLGLIGVFGLTRRAKKR